MEYEKKVDDKQFHQYQQNEHLSLTSDHWTQKYHDKWRCNPGLRQAEKCGGIKQVNGMPNLSLLIIEFPTTTQI